MGEYWKPVNVTRKEYIHPHNVGCGLKLPEWNSSDSAVWRIIAKAWSETDDVRAVSDYGGEMQLQGERGAEDVDYEAIHSDDYKEISQ